MNHYITFEQSPEGDKGYSHLCSQYPDSWAGKRLEITENETGGGNPPKQPESPWITYYFVTDSMVDEKEASEFASNLPGSLNWDFNLQR